jgi:uncharacterized protein
MPKAKDAVTESALKRRTYIFCAAILFAVSILYFGIIKFQTPSNKVKAKIGGKTILLEVADSEAKRMAGLSNRATLENNHGMLFEFDKPARHCFWMKDMKFSLDILWFDENKNMVHHEHDVAPATYPDSYCADNTKYVVEINAGMMKNLGIGETAQLEL